MIHDSRSFALLAWALLASTVGGCWPALTPRPQDSNAPRDFYSQVRPSESKCDREIAVFPAGATPGRPHKEVASLSATCSPGAIDVCERQMKERACELGADALVLAEPSAGPNPAGPSGQSLVSRNGRAIRWQPQ
jgi:hypothetical protein